MTIPAIVDEVTPRWMSEALGREVREVAVLDAHSGTTGRARLGLDGDDVPDSVFVKLQPFVPERRDFVRMTGLGVAEARLYAAVGAELPVRAPAVWHSSFDDEDGSFIMVLEDLVAAGARFLGVEDADVLEVTVSLVDELATLHATYWGQDLPWLAGYALTAGGGEEQEARMAGGAAMVQMALDQFSDDLPSAFEELCQLYADRYRDVGALWDEGDPTLIHGDDHIGNLFLDGGRVGFYDWAVASRLPGVRDVAYFLCNSLPGDVRRTEEQALLARYRAGLAEQGVDVGEVLVQDQYRLFAVYSWVAATATAALGDALQPFEIGHAAMVRTTEAIIDLDCLGLLHERLGAG